MPAEIPRHRMLDAADRAEARADRGPERRQGRGRLSSMDLIPEEGQDDIVWAVAELNKREKTANEILFELNDRLAAKDIDPISKSAFNRKSVKLAAMSNRLNEARHIFTGLAPQFTAEKVDEGTIVLGEFIKLLLFELAQNEGAAIGTKGAMELARAYLAAIQAQKISAERRRALEADFKAEAEKAIEKVAKVRGVSAEATEALRRELFGITPEAGRGA
ncbi:phage protein Gp27 family protein [uncultured Methylobacterium sp.]|uniref:phage protein Gp27 family protein n=1 Tax=uncultured Methylobacterium sp. TaxID=157278 RepID=UPI0025885A0E|nr:phage protein Gp27 family protein [uncultured Methylobacterium sp.]